MIDHTKDLAQLKEQLASETNKKAELWGLLMEAGSNVNTAQKNLFDAKDVYMKVKVQIRQVDEKIKTLKTIIKAEREIGG